jgi:two-component system, OmpR family, sensor kinase
VRRPGAISLRVRLAAASALVAALVLSALAVLVGLQVRDAGVTAATQLARADLQSYVVDLMAQPQEGPDRPAAGLLILVVAPDGRVARDSMPAELSKAVRAPHAVEDVALEGGRFRVVHRDVRSDDGTWHLWAARDLTASDALLRGVLMTVVAGIPIAVLGTGLAAWLVASGALRPVERMRVAADRLRAPGATGALPTLGGEELARLGATLNALIADLRTSVAHERRVTADAAHELRTPLAVLAAQVELAQRRPASADLPAIRASVDRLTRLADDLLALSRAEGSPGSATLVRVGDLVTEAMDAVDRARLLAPAGVLVDLELVEPFDEGGTVPIDRTSFGRIITNLVSNALAAGPASAVVVRLRQTDRVVVLEVQDDGPGLPDDFLPFAFDRFSRPAGARSRGAAGAGLGLALVKRLAEQAGGTAALRNGPAGGALATVRLPLPRTVRPERP